MPTPFPNKPGPYQFHDMDLAAALKTLGYKVECRLEGPRAVFSVEQDETLRKTLDDYHTGRLLLEPKSFSFSRKSVRMTIDSLKGPGNTRVWRAP